MSNNISETHNVSSLLVENSPAALLVVDNMHITYVNEAATHVFHTSVSDLTGLSLSDLNQSQDTLASLISCIQRACTDNTSQQQRIDFISGAGLRHYLATFKPTQGNVYIYLQDISALIKSEKALAAQATHDTLTGLLNRSQLFFMGAQDIARAIRYQHPISVLVVTILNIRHINQSYGYAMGDHVLINISRALRDVLRESDYAARLDNTSFVVCLLDATCEQTDIVVNRVKTAISARDIIIADTNIPLEILYGTAEFDSTIDTQFDDLLLRAEKDCIEI